MSTDFGTAIAELTMQEAGGSVQQFSAVTELDRGRGPLPKSGYATAEQLHWYRKGYNSGYRAGERLKR